MKESTLQNERRALGYRITELRKKVMNPDTGKFISQEELGFRTGYAKKTIGEIERGNSNPTFETLMLISKELNVTIRELFNFDLKDYVMLSRKDRS